ncbi:hypothetical protein Dimus_012771, partial [Dionaea muscipula]
SLTVEGLAAAESTGATSGADQRGPTRSWAVHGCMETTSFESASGGYLMKVEHAGFGDGGWNMPAMAATGRNSLKSQI